MCNTVSPRQPESWSGVQDQKRRSVEEIVVRFKQFRLSGSMSCRDAVCRGMTAYVENSDVQQKFEMHVRLTQESRELEHIQYKIGELMRSQRDKRGLPT